MIIVDGKKYAESVSEMIDSLFNDGSGTLPLLPAIAKKAIKKAAAEYKESPEAVKNQKKIDYLKTVQGVFNHKIDIIKIH